MKQTKEYSVPEVELIEVAIDMGFAQSSDTENVGKDDEIEF